MVRTKELAESQFDASAPPISLGIKFGQFCAFELDAHIMDQDDDEITDFSIFSDEINDIPIESKSLALIANDLDPETRDLEYERVQNQEEDKEFDELADSFFQHIDNNVAEIEKVDSIDFMIKHSEIKKNLTELRTINKVTTAIRLTTLAIDKLDDNQKKLFDLENTNEDRNYYQGLALIDKSISSIKFINQLGQRIMNQFMDRFPDRFKELPNDDELIIDWLNNQNGLSKQMHLIFSSAFIATKIKFTNIETNDNPGLNLGLKHFVKLKCHQILRIIHLHTISINSNRFRNITKFVKKFSLVFGGSRLHYLEHLISESEKGYIFFESHEDNFSQLDRTWKNSSFPYHDNDVLFKLSRLD